MGERKELERLPEIIEKLEEEHAKLIDEMARPDFYQISKLTSDEAATSLADLEKKQEAAFSRWEELESIPKKS